MGGKKAADPIGKVETLADVHNLRQKKAFFILTRPPTSIEANASAITLVIQ